MNVSKALIFIAVFTLVSCMCKSDEKASPSGTNQSNANESAIPEIVVPSVNAVTLDVGIVESNPPTYYYNGKAVSPENVSTYDVDSINDDVDSYLEYQKYFKDLRNLLHEKKAYTSQLSPWVEVYQDMSGYTIDSIALPSGIKMIAEASYPRNSIELCNLKHNLELYKSYGYNAVLVTFTCTEGIENVSNLIDVIKQYGMMVFFSFSGEESFDANVFIDPQLLKNYITAIAPKSDGMLLGWRRTSSHLFMQDAEFSAYLAKCSRDANSKIYIVGECFFGETGDSNLSNAFFITKLNNVSGVAITGVGVYGISSKRFMNIYMSNVTCRKLAVILGSKPHYLTLKNTGKTFDENLAIKHAIMNSWINAGCDGAIVIHGDGSNGRINPNITDDLSRSVYK